MSTGGQDLFVVCKSCGSEVSPYITECPYCGNRLRKRAPKIDRDGRVTERRRRRPPGPALPPLRPGEIPGIRGETRPYATIGLVVLGLVGCLIWRTALIDLGKLVVAAPDPLHHPWRIVTTAFTYNNTGYAVITLGAIAVYGWLVERRHGPLAVLVLFALGAFGGVAAAAALKEQPLIMGANGGALALICAWAMQDLVTLGAGGEIDGDLLGTAVFGSAVALMPLVAPEASWIADGVGVVVGSLVGYPVSRLAAR